MTSIASSPSQVAPSSAERAGQSYRHGAGSSGVARQVVGRPGQLSPACAARAVAFLRQRHPVKTAASVAATTGLSAEAVKKWLERSSAPSFVACFALIRAYGPDFLTAVMEHPPAWIDTAARTARREALARDIARLTAELDRLDP